MRDAAQDGQVTHGGAQGDRDLLILSKGGMLAGLLLLLRVARLLLRVARLLLLLLLHRMERVLRMTRLVMVFSED